MALGFPGDPAGRVFVQQRAFPSRRIRSDGQGAAAGRSRPEAAQEGSPRGPFRRPGRRLRGRGPRHGEAAARKRAVGRFSVSGRMNSSRIRFFFYFRSILNMNLNEFA